jgi:hypothetical protein
MLDERADHGRRRGDHVGTDLGGLKHVNGWRMLATRISVAKS